MTRWRLGARIAVALLAVGVATLSVVGLAASAFVDVRNSQQRVVDDYYEAVTTSHDQFLLLVDAEAAVRGYLLTGNGALLEPLQALQDDSGAGERLHSLLRQDDEALAALDAASAAAVRWWQDWAVPTVNSVGSGGPAAVSQDQAEQGQRLFDEVRRDFAVYLDAVSDRRQQEAQVLEETTTRLFLAVVAIAVVAIAGVAVLGWLLRRWVTRPVSALAQESRRVHDGALEHRVTVDGPPEIVRLARDVDDMRKGLVDQIATVRSARDRLEAAHVSLEEQAADLERSNRELEQFAYVASHDLQEPLRKLASFCQLLQRRYAGQLDERADQYIEFAVDGAKRMQQLINDLLDFSRVGRLTAPQADVALDTCLDRALRDLTARIDESDAVVTHDELPTVLGEASLLTQVLTNLIGNALKFRVDGVAPRIHIGARRLENGWELSCADNGIGIEAQYADRVFAIFQRLHAKDVYNGTGIGLAICKKIVEYHGGTIWVDTQTTGTGTTVRWTLPARVDDGVSGHAPSGHAPSGPEPSGPVRSGPVRSGPVRSGPARSGPARSGPAPSAPAPSAMGLAMREDGAPTSQASGGAWTTGSGGTP